MNIPIICGMIKGEINDIKLLNCFVSLLRSSPLAATIRLCI